MSSVTVAQQLKDKFFLEVSASTQAMAKDYEGRLICILFYT